MRSGTVCDTIGSTRNEQLRIAGGRLLFGRPRPDTHRGWLARHGGRAAPVAAAAGAAAAPPVPEFPFALTADETVPEEVRTRAAAVVAHASRFAQRPILFARMTIRTERDPAARRPIAVTAALDVSGRIVVAHAAADTQLDAIDLVERRLRRRLDELDSRRRALRRKRAVAAEEDASPARSPTPGARGARTRRS